MKKLLTVLFFSSTLLVGCSTNQYVNIKDTASTPYVVIQKDNLYYIPLESNENISSKYQTLLDDNPNLKVIGMESHYDDNTSVNSLLGMYIITEEKENK